MIGGKAALVLVAVLGVGAAGVAVQQGVFSGPPAAIAAKRTLAVTITGAQGAHVFDVERATTSAEQARGLMYRTDLKPDGGMLFWPYPPEGGAPRVANFWMKNTPTPLDILFIRADGTIATIAENTVPFSEAPVSSREPIAAVLELVGGRTADLGIAEGDRVAWAK
ncbi:MULTISPECIES: DUF192 domain-containing protein [Sphingomonas]|uniref:DUF192 domain-containing protein n=1 Tax=Sphingomonas kyungheensis TaxID=1069987 RepID=A0ABU8GZ65_9SPHN|nr:MULTISPECIES: DUF192 domain-containing protein [unclassified Sphingomonas]EZP54675.1 hypothetical protein BW41_01412 [Sphingomonas sp. RIT328]